MGLTATRTPASGPFATDTNWSAKPRACHASRATSFQASFERRRRTLTGYGRRLSATHTGAFMDRSCRTQLLPKAIQIQLQIHPRVELASHERLGRNDHGVCV